LAPLFTIGGGLGATLGALAALAFPGLGIDPRIAGLVGMAAIFAGASRALLASVVFAFETTLQPLGLLPLLGGCSAAFLLSCLLMRNTIMTEKIARRGVRVPSEYAADFLDQVSVAQFASRDVIAFAASDSLVHLRKWFESGADGCEHHGFPVVDAHGQLLGIVTKREIENPRRAGELLVEQLIKRAATVAFEDNSLREAADLMVNLGVGRLPVVSRAAPKQVIGMLTRSDLLAAHARRLNEDDQTRPRLKLPFVRIVRV
ncbi:MAG TPA: CBS domain-containing protein, partial [Polyangiaceae bacterium]